MLNIVIPMAGRGSRFANVGYIDPKPLIPVKQYRMIELVIRNLTPIVPHRFIFICQRAHVEAYRLTPKLQGWAPGCEIVQLDGVTEGAACTVLTAKDLINSDDPLMIANSDQYLDLDINDYLATQDEGELDGLIMTLTADDPKWSFVALNENNLVTDVREKEVISNEATTGIYNFRHGREFVAAAEAMIVAKQQVNGEYYVAPVYNLMIANGARIGIHNIGRELDGMYGLGTPKDLEDFLAHPIAAQI